MFTTNTPSFGFFDVKCKRKSGKPSVLRQRLAIKWGLRKLCDLNENKVQLTVCVVFLFSLRCLIFFLLAMRCVESLLGVLISPRNEITNDV